MQLSFVPEQRNSLSKKKRHYKMPLLNVVSYRSSTPANSMGTNTFDMMQLRNKPGK